MKKLLLSLVTVAMGFGVANADQYSCTLTSNDHPNANTFTGESVLKLSDSTNPDLTVDWSLKGTKVSKSWYFGFDSNSSKGVQFGSAKSAFKTLSLSTDFFADKEVQKVTMNLSQGGKASFTGTLTVGSKTLNITATTNATDYTLENLSETGASISLDVTNSNTATTSNGAFYIKSITVEYSTASGPSKTAVTLSYPEANYTALLGEGFNIPVLTVDPADAASAVVYASEHENIATVDANGNVTLLAAGTTKITASIPDTNETYKYASASYTLTVIDPNSVEIYTSAMGEDFEIINATGQTYPWSHDTTYGLKGSGYVNKTTNACEGIAYSPVIDLSVYTYATLEFQQAFNQYKINNNSIDVKDFAGKYAFLVVREEGNEEWTVIGEPTAPSAFSWDFFANDPVDLSAYVGKKIQFGFKYVSTSTCAGTWEVKEIAVTGVKAPVVATPAKPVIKFNGEEVGENISFEGDAENEPLELEVNIPEGAALYVYYPQDVVAATYAAEEEDEENPTAIEIDGKPYYNATEAIENNKLQLPALKGEYSFFTRQNGVNSEPVSFNLDISTGVAEIEIANGEAVYFDLNGREVKGQLEKGLYIRVQNGKATKTLVF